MHDKTISLFFALLLLSSSYASSSAHAQVSDTSSIILTQHELSKFDSGLYEKIQDRINLHENSSVTLSDVEMHHDVIFIVSDNPSKTSDQSKDSLETLLQEIGVTEFYKAESLSFVTARVPINDLQGIAQQSYVSKVGDGEKQMKLLGLDGPDDGVVFSSMYEAKEMVSANNLEFDGTGIISAIIDAGIFDNHPDFINKEVLEVKCNVSKCVESNTFHEHGTAQAGIITANHNEVGVAPDSVFFDIDTDTAIIGASARFANSLDFSLTQGADIANISLGSEICSEKYSAISIIVDEAIDKGMLVVSGTGFGDSNDNDQALVNPTIQNPACSINTISVGALDKDGKIWDRKTLNNRNDYSSRGPTFDGRIKPELVAPGVNVYVQTYNPDNSAQLYAHQTGTSHAAPFVTGAAAVLLEKKPEYTSLETKSALLLGATWDPQNLIPNNQYPITAQKYETVSALLTNTISATLNAYGFGTLNVQQSLDYMEYGFIYRDFFDITASESQKQYKIRTTAGEQTKVIVSWLHHHEGSILDLDSTSYPTIHDRYSNIDLSIASPGGNTITSNSLKQNNEFIVFNPEESGDYTVTVSLPYSPRTNDETFVLGTTALLVFDADNLDPHPPTILNQDTVLGVNDKEDKHDASLKRHEFTVTAYDANGDSLSFEVRTNPTHGMLSVAEYDTPTKSKFVYTYDDSTFDVISEDSFDLVAFDGLLYSNVATFKIKQENQKENTQNIGTASQGNARQKTVNESGYHATLFDLPSASSLASSESQILSANTAIVAIRSTSSDVQNPLLHYTINSIPYTMSIAEDSARTVIFDGSFDISNIHITTEDIAEGKNNGMVSVEYFASQSRVVPNQPPTAAAGSDQSVDEVTLVHLDAAGSTDPEGETPLRYQWHQRSGPDVELIGGGFASSIVSFVAPDVEQQTVLTFEVQVKDPHLSSDTDVVSILVNNVEPQDNNTSPKAKAGDDQTIHEGSLVILDGRKSSDPNGDNLTYSWQQTDSTGIIPSLSHLNSAVTSFAAPLVEQDVTLTFELTVSDGMVSHSDVTNIIISDVSGSSTLPLIQNPFPDGNDDFGYAVSGNNDGMVIVGTPFEDLVEFPNIPSSAESFTLSNIIDKKIFSFRNPDGAIAYLAEINNPESRFAIKSYKIEINSDDLMSLNLFVNDTTSLLSLTDDSGNILAASHDIMQQNDIATLGHTAHHDIVAFTSTITNSTVLFDRTSGIALAEVANNAGAAYLYDNTASLVRAIPNPHAGSSDRFGHTVTPFGDSGFVIGAPESDVGTTNAGAAYVYQNNLDSSPNTLTASNPVTSDEFGYAMASDGAIVVVGSPESANGGAVTIFDGVTGSRLFTISNPTGTSADDFGKSVSINSGSIIVGAPFDDVTSNSAGTVYLFEKSSPYSQITQLDYPGHTPFSYFGKTLAATDDVIVVGATGTINSGIRSGSVQVFDNNGTHLGSIPNPAPKNGDKFGESVSVSDKYIIIGNTKANHPNATSAGAAYLYNTTSFLQLAEIQNPTPESGDLFGNSVFVSDTSNRITVGAPDNQVDSVDSGSAYLFLESDFFTTNNPPIAIAGNDRTVIQKSIVTLNGSASFDPDVNNSLTYFWNHTTTPQPIITLNDTDSAAVKLFAAPDVTTPLQLTFELIVNDGINSSTPDEITITVTNPDYNEAPIIGTILNQTIAEGSITDVMVLANDADGDSIIFSASIIPNFAALLDYSNGTAKISMSPGYGDAGNYSVVFRATDGRNSTLHHEKSFEITVTDQAIPPVAINDGIISTLEDVPVLIDVLSNDYDADYVIPANGTGAASFDGLAESSDDIINGVINNQGTFVAYHSTTSAASLLSQNLAVDSVAEILESTDDVSSSEIIADITQSKENLDSAKYDVVQSTVSFESSKQDVLEELSQYRVAINLYGDGQINRDDLLQEKSELLSSKSKYSDTKQTFQESQETLHEIIADLKVEPQINLVLDGDSSQYEKISVYVEVAEDVNNDVLDNLDVTTQHENIIVTALTESELQAIAQSDDVASISIPHLPELFAVSQGVAISYADELHNSEITGENVTVAIIDDSFILSDDKISDNISYSALFDSVGFCNGVVSCGKSQSNSHGAAVAGIVADMAPDVSLELYAITNSIDFVNAISHIIQRGDVDVISISLGFPTLGGDGTTGHFRDGTSHVAQAVDLAKNSGIIVVSAAGNSAEGHWNGQYTASSTISPDSIGLSGYQSVMEFAPEQSGLSKACLPVSHNSLTILTWDDWYTSSQNYDLFLYDSTMSNILRDSRQNQNEIPGTPLERIYGSAIPSACLVVASYDSTQDHNLHVYSIGGKMLDDSLAVSEFSLSTPADAIHSITVGAINYNDGSLESFSSRGPTDDGRAKPEICGYDKVSSDIPSLNPFPGTSAAAPHVAGATALLHSAFPSYTNDDIEYVLLNNTKSGIYSDSNLCGSGVVSLYNIANHTDNGAININQTSPHINPYNLTVHSIDIMPQNGTALIIDNAIVYLPDVNFYGNDSFEYVVEDTDGLLSDAATVSVNVNQVNDPPVLFSISDVTISEGTTKVIPINLSDVDGNLDVITVTTNGTLPSFADLQYHSNGTAHVTMSPTVEDSGVYPIMIIVEDSGLPEPLSDSAEFTITVTDADITPPEIELLGDDSITVPLGGIFSDPGVTATDSVDGDIAHLVVVDNPVNSLLPDVYVVTYTITDSSGNESEIIRQVTVSNTADHISTVYGDGTDGNLEVTDNVILSGIKNYKNVIIRDGGTITVPQGETLHLKINGTLAFESGGMIDLDGKGSLGGTGGISVPGAGGIGGTQHSYSSFTCFNTPIGCAPSYHGFPGGAPSDGIGIVGNYGGTAKSAGAGGSSGDYAGASPPLTYVDVTSFADIQSYIHTQQKMSGGAGGTGGSGTQSGYGTHGGAGHWASYRDHGIRSGTNGSPGAQSAVGGAGGDGGGAISISANVLYGDVSITARGNHGSPGESARGASAHGAGGGGGGSGGIIGIIYSQLLSSDSQLLTFDNMYALSAGDTITDHTIHTLDESSISLDVSGGTGGVGGESDESEGTDGNSGGAGFDGVIFLQQISGFDSISPEISLIGDDSIDVYFGTTYEDPGSTITDNDVIYSGVVIIDSTNVDMNTLGTYTVSYSGTPDFQGNIPDTITRTINVIPNPIFGYATLGSLDVIGDVSLPSGIYHYDDLTIHDNSNLITNGQTIIYINGTYSEIGSGHITVNPIGCSGGSSGTTQGGAGGAGGGVVISSSGRYGLPGSPGSPQTIIPPQTAPQCDTSDVSLPVDVMDISDTFAEEFMGITGSTGSDGISASSSGSGGTGAPGYYYRLSGPDRYGSGQPGGDGGTGAQGTYGVSGGGTLAIFAKSIGSDTITISASGSNGNDGNQGTGEPGEPGFPGAQQRVRSNYYWIPASYPGSAASSAGTLGSDGSQGGIVYVGYGNAISGFAANIDVSGGAGGMGGANANGVQSSQIGAIGPDGFYFVRQVADVSPPTITLNGSSTMTVQYGDTFADPGGVAADDTDGNITENIVIINPVDTNVIGEYHITYDITDSAGNHNTKTRTVNIVDTVPPIITISGSLYRTVEYGGYSEDEDSLLLSTTNSTQIITAIDPVDGSIPVSTSNSTVNIFEIGNYTTIYTATDKHGNEAIPANVNTIVRDTIHPVLSLIGNDTLHTEYDIPFDDPGAIAVDPVDGDISDGIVITGFVDVSLFGNYTITYDVTDSNGNAADSVSRTVLVQDNTSPIITLNNTEQNPQIIELGAGYTELGASTNDGSAIVINYTVFVDAIGSYDITYDSVDDSGNHATHVIRTIHVVDTTPPAIIPPENHTAEATAIKTVLNNIGNATASDLSSVVITSNATSRYSLGNTTVIWTATDSSGNNSTASQIITILDTTTPKITVPSDVTFEATAADTPLSELDYGTATADDIFAPVTITSNATATFPLGTTTINWTVTDTNGLNATATQTVIITDTTIPSITPPIAFTAEATAVDTVLTQDDYGTATGSDIFAPVVIISDAPSDFPLGDTTITWTATDDNDFVATATQTITIRDTAIPSITPPIAFTAEATALNTPLTQSDYGTATATDIFGSTITSDAPATFPLNNTTILWTAIDTNGLNATATQDITITDTTAPTITPPPAFTAEATAVNTPLTQSDYGTATATDIFGSTITSDAPATFPLNNTTILWTAIDTNGLNATATQDITITDTTAPTITPPPAFTAEATAVNTPLTQSDYGTATATDIFNPVTITNNATATFPLGTTAISWVATDANGLNSTATQIVTLTDTTAPTITPPPAFTAEATAVNTPLTQSDYGTATATDLFNPVTITNNATATFQLGTTTIAYTATDGNGLTNSTTQTITVTDTTAPVITILGDNPQTVEAYISEYSDAGATAHDNIDGNVTQSIVITNPVNSTVIDTYTVEYFISDLSGNNASASRIVTVQDTTAPVIITPDDVTAEATAVFTIIPIQNATATDASLSSSSPVIITNNATEHIADGFPLGTTAINWVATDASDNVATATQIVTIQDTTAPVISLLGNATMSVPFDSAYVDAGATAADIYDGNLTGSITTINPVNTSSAGNYTVTYDVTDSSNNDALQNLRTVTILPKPDSPPVIDVIGDITIDEGQIRSITVNATDPDGDAITYSLVQTPPSFVNMTNDDNNNTTITISPTYADSGNYTATVVATSNDLSYDTSFAITVYDVDRSPTITPINNVILDEGETEILTVNATDPDGDVITYLLTQNSPSFANIINHTITIFPTFTDSGNYTATVNATSNDKSASTSFVIIVNDDVTEPTIPIDPAKWAGTKTVTLSHENVSGDDSLANFPLLVSFTDESLQSARADGADLTFTNITNHTIPFEIESWDGTTGTITSWVNIPVLSASEDTVILLHYANPSQLTSLATPESVWNDDEYLAVYHMSDVDDSTIHDNDGANSGATSTQGKISNSQNFDGINNRVILPNDKGLNLSGDTMTISAWVNPDVTDGTHAILGKSHDSLHSSPYYEWLLFQAQDRYHTRASSTAFNAGTVTANTWQYVTATYDGASLALYVNGILESSTPKTNLLQQSDQSPTIGGRNTPDNNNPDAESFDGQIDEVRISNVTKSAHWIATEYTNQNDPGSFYTIIPAPILPDITSPVITLTGDNPQTIQLGDTYTELGAITDDGSPITIDDSAFADVVGSYTILYDSVDSAGNAATQVARIVHVVDFSSAEKKTITINHDKVSGDDSLTNYPLLVSFADVSLQSARADGADITFTDTNHNVLPFEIESWDGATGTITSWVNISTLSTSQDTVIYLHYNNPSQTISQADPESVWKNDAFVAHFADENPILDSSANNATATNHGTTFADASAGGKIGGARSFDGASWIDYDDSALPSSDNPRTISLWTNPDTLNSGWHGIMAYGIPAGNGTPAGSVFGFFHNGNNLWGGGYGDDVNANYRLDTNQWSKLDMTYDGTTVTTYVNGEQTATDDTKNWDTILEQFRIGRQVNTAPEYFTGLIDEARISNVAKSADYIKTEYANQNNPNSFYVITPEPVIPDVTPPIITLTGNNPQTIQLGNPYVELGATTDDGSTVTMDDSAFAYAVGTYLIRYDSADYAGNAATPVTRTVHVVDLSSSADAKAITINPDHVSGTADMINYPLLVSFADDVSLQSARADGADITFTDTNNNVLPFEIESWNSTTGSIVSWVNIPTLSASEDTVIYLHYNNPSQTVSLAEPSDVWKNDAFVAHFAAATTAADDILISDSTIHNATATNHGTTFADASAGGKIGGARSFDGASWIDYDDSALPSSDNPRTISLWTNPDTLNSGWHGIMAYGIPAGNGTPAGSVFGFFHNGNNLWGGGYGDDVNANYRLDTNQWSKLDMTYDGTTVTTYVNGEQTATDDTKNWDTILEQFRIGRQVNTAPEYFTGLIDEARISNVAKSADYIKTEYANQNDPNSFYTVETVTP